MNARRQKNTEDLINRLRKRREALRGGGVRGVRVGSFGVSYAKYHEFGTDWSEKMAWFILRIGKENASAGKRQKRQSKGVVEFKVLDDVLMARIRPRPYLFRAQAENADKIREIIASVNGEKPVPLDRALIRIGMLLETQIVRNIRDKRSGKPRGPIIDNGALINSIRYELIK